MRIIAYFVLPGKRQLRRTGGDGSPPVKLELAWKVSVGAGGAITALSESTDEYEEMLLKASCQREYFPSDE